MTQKQMTENEIRLLADLSGDDNPLHLDGDFASRSMFEPRVAHGMLTASLISAAPASMLGAMTLTSICLSIENCVHISEELVAGVTVTNVQNSKVDLITETLRGADTACLVPPRF